MVVQAWPEARTRLFGSSRSAAGNGDPLAGLDGGAGQGVELLDPLHHVAHVTGLGHLAGDE